MNALRFLRAPVRAPEDQDCLKKNRDIRINGSPKRFGAVEWIRTTTVLLPPAPQAGASASSATTAQRNLTPL